MDRRPVAVEVWQKLPLMRTRWLPSRWNFLVRQTACHEALWLRPLQGCEPWCLQACGPAEQAHLVLWWRISELDAGQHRGWVSQLAAAGLAGSLVWGIKLEMR